MEGLRLDLIMLVAGCLGAFLSRKSDPNVQTASWGTLWYVLVTGAVTYLCADLVPDKWQAMAGANPIKAGAAAFVTAGLAGAVLVDKASQFIKAFAQQKAP